MIPCPYCAKPNQTPAMQYVGSWFRCPHCQQKWLFDGTKAVSIQQVQGQSFPTSPHPPQVNTKIVVQQSKRGLGIGDGFKLACGVFLFVLIAFVILPLVFIGGACSLIFR